MRLAVISDIRGKPRGQRQPWFDIPVEPKAGGIAVKGRGSGIRRLDGGTF